MSPEDRLTVRDVDKLAGRSGSVVHIDDLPGRPYFTVLVQLDDGPRVWFHKGELDAEAGAA